MPAMDSDSKANGLNGSSNGVDHPAAPTGPMVGPKRRRRSGVAPAPPAPAGDVETQAAPATEPAPPPQATTPAPAPTPIELKRFSPHYKRIAQPDLALEAKAEDGWEEAPSAFIYDSESNGRRPVKMLCTDVRMWPGLGEVIYARSKMSITVTLPNGELFECPPGVTIAYPACNELLDIVQKMEANPSGVVEAIFAPIGERPTDLDKYVTHYRVFSRVVPGLSRETAWRGG